MSLVAIQSMLTVLLFMPGCCFYEPTSIVESQAVAGRGPQVGLIYSGGDEAIRTPTAVKPSPFSRRLTAPMGVSFDSFPCS